MTGIFISYSRTDEIFARLLASDLERTGATIWIDVEDIPFGVDWRNEIENGLEQSAVMLLILSPESMASRHVRMEWMYFVDAHKPIVPILWRDGADIPPEIERLNYIDGLHQTYAATYSQLRATLQRLKCLPKFSTYKYPIVSESHDVPEVDALVHDARDISIIAITSYLLIGGVYFPTLNKCLKSGCNIAVVLINPYAASAVQTTESLMNYTRIKKDTELMLDHYDALINSQGDGFGKCEVRLVDFFMPYSMVGVDMTQPTGLIRVSYSGYRKSGKRTPHVVYTPQQKSSWYEFYIKQFQRLWENAMPYVPSGQ